MRTFCLHQRCVHYFLLVTPRFTRLLENQTVRETNSAGFVCEVYPIDSDVVWTKNGSVLNDKEDKIEVNSSGNQRELVIKNTEEQDAGIVSAFLGENDTHAELKVEGILMKIYDLLCHFRK